MIQPRSQFSWVSGPRKGLEERKKKTKSPQQPHCCQSSDLHWDFYRVSVLRIDSQGSVTRAHDHKQGFGPLEKITLIITGCIWTCPQQEGGRSGRQGLTEKEKAREQATSAGAFLHAVSYWCRVSPQFAQRFPQGGEGAKGY